MIEHDYEQLGYHLLQQKAAQLTEDNPRLSRLLLTPERDIFDIVKTYAKIYPTMTKYYVYDTPRRIRRPGFESKSIETNQRRKPRGEVESLVADLSSVRRTKTRISDIILSNNFDLFCTFTFAKDRQDTKLLKKRMSRWLKNQHRLIGAFDYIIVPEFHKDGKSIHFHALFKGYAGELVDSGHKRKDGRKVYNISNYPYGFSTATKIDALGVPKVASYVKKYITKDMPYFPGQRRYWVSQGLIRPKKVPNPVVFPADYEKLGTPYRTQGYSLFQTDTPIDFVPAA